MAQIGTWGTQSTTRSVPLLRHKKKRWRDPEESIGILIATQGKVKCWALQGRAYEAWRSLHEAIDACVAGLNLSRGVLYECLMCGKIETKAVPTIIFWGADKPSRALVQQTVIDDGLLDKPAYLGFETLTMPRVPGFENLVPFTREDSLPGIRIHSEPQAHLAVQLASQRLPPQAYSIWKQRRSGGLVIVKFVKGRLVIAGTITAQLTINNQLYWLASAHTLTSFTDLQEFQLPYEEDDSELLERLFDQDSEADSDSDIVSGDAQAIKVSTTTSDGDHYSGSPHRHGLTLSHSEAQHHNFGEDFKDNLSPIAATAPAEIVVEPSITIRTPVEPVTQYLSVRDYSAVAGWETGLLVSYGFDALDYALIDIPEDVDLCNEHPLPVDLQALSSISSSSTISCVQAETASHEAQPGTLSTALTSMRLRTWNSTCKLWTFVPSKKPDGYQVGLRPGDSGTRVSDHEGRIFGHVIAGDTESGLAYVLPFQGICADIRRRFGTLTAIDSTDCRCHRTLTDLEREKPQDVGSIELMGLSDQRRTYGADCFALLYTDDGLLKRVRLGGYTKPPSFWNALASVDYWRYNS